MTTPVTHKAVIKMPGEAQARRYTLVRTDSELRALQAVVGGYIELLGRLAANPSGSVICYVNEEGKLYELPYNFTCGFGRYAGEPILGPAIFVGENDEGDLRDLTDAEVSAILKMFGKEIVAP